MDGFYGSVYYRGPPIIRRPRPKSLCSRCGGVAQDISLVRVDRDQPSDRGPCGLSIEVDGREGRTVRRRHSSTGPQGRKSRGRSTNPLPVSTGAPNIKKGDETTYRQFFRSPPPEEFKSRVIRSLPKSPITSSPPSATLLTTQDTSVYQGDSNSSTKPHTNSNGHVKQTDCSPGLVYTLNGDTHQAVPKPKKGKESFAIAVKSQSHQPLWAGGTDVLRTSQVPRQSWKGSTHQPLWGDNATTTQPAKIKVNSVNKFTHQPLWDDNGNLSAPAPRIAAKGFSDQQQADGNVRRNLPVPRREAARNNSESSVILPPAGIKTVPPASLSSISLT